jgi:SAM-dependent methyltransferase
MAKSFFGERHIPLEFFFIGRKVKRNIRKLFSNGKDLVIDIGSGKSNYHEYMKGKIVSFDIQQSDKVSVIGDADFLPFREGKFDKIITINSMYLFKYPHKFVEASSKILKKGGKLVFMNPYFYPVHDAPNDRYRFSRYGIETLLEKNFKIEKIESMGGFFSLPAIIIHSMLKGIPILFPKPLQGLAYVVSFIVFYIPYLLAQLFSLLDFLDRTGRYPMYYFVVATKK